MAISKFRPCIDLHGGQVKQIVGSTLTDADDAPQENFVSSRSSVDFAKLFKADQLTGGHVIKLGPGNEDAARKALQSWPQGLQIGGGINRKNAAEWITAGASHVIVTSSVFSQTGEFLKDELEALSAEVGKENLVIDLSCKRNQRGWTVAMNRWQTLTTLDLTHDTLSELATLCDEFLIHAADVEGLCSGMDADLVKMLGKWASENTDTPITYAGGIVSMKEIETIQTESHGHVHYTVGSALDEFGGSGIKYRDLVQRNSQ